MLIFLILTESIDTNILCINTCINNHFANICNFIELNKYEGKIETEYNKYTKILNDTNNLTINLKEEEIYFVTYFIEEMYFIYNSLEFVVLYVNNILIGFPNLNKYSLIRETVINNCTKINLFCNEILLFFDDKILIQKMNEVNELCSVLLKSLIKRRKQKIAYALFYQLSLQFPISIETLKINNYEHFKIVSDALTNSFSVKEYFPINRFNNDSDFLFFDFVMMQLKTLLLNDLNLLYFNINDN